MMFLWFFSVNTARCHHQRAPGFASVGNSAASAEIVVFVLVFRTTGEFRVALVFERFLVGPGPAVLMLHDVGYDFVLVFVVVFGFCFWLLFCFVFCFCFCFCLLCWSVS